MSIVVIDSGQAGNTAEMVAQVAQRRPAVDEALSHMGELLHATLPALLAGDLSAIGKAWTKNHRLLQDVGVSNRRLDEIVSLAVAAGATGAKLAGAGGGGVVIALAHRPNDIVEAAKSAGFNSFVTQCCGAGLP